MADHANQSVDGREPPVRNGDVTRRSFIQTLGLSAAAGAVRTRVDAATAQATGPAAPATFGPDAGLLRLTVNGRPLEATVEPCTTLMEVLRWHAGLTGTKEVCDRGSCGACSVLVDGKLVVSCMMLALDARDSQVTTIEGLGTDGALDPLQLAFIRHDALQCGFCTPGLLMACKALLAANPRPDLDQIKAGLAGNLCRCGTYTNVFNAVLEVSGQSPIVDAEGTA